MNQADNGPETINEPSGPNHAQNQEGLGEAKAVDEAGRQSILNEITEPESPEILAEPPAPITEASALLEEPPAETFEHSEQTGDLTSSSPVAAETAPRPSPQQSVARSAGIVSIAVMFSRIMGLVREQVFAYFFGAGFLNDAYQLAFRIPNVLRDLFAEGALSAAFVKVFTDYQITKGEKEAWRLAGLVFNGLAVVLSVITLIGIIFSRQFVDLIADGFGPEQAALATTLTQIMFPFILLVAMAAVAMGVLNTRGRFGIPASASTVFNITSIIFGLGLAYWLSGGSWQVPHDPKSIPSPEAQWAITGMAIGTLIGGASQFLIQVPSLLRVGFRFLGELSFSDPGVRRVVNLMGPAIIGTSAVQINVLVNTFFVSGIQGGISWLNYAFRLMQFPIGLFGVAVGTASVPVLSRMASENRLDDFRNTLSSSLGLVFLMTIPAACGLIVLGQPIIRLLYSNGGAFRESDVPMTAYALAGYSIGLAGYAAIKVLSPAFYALDDARTPMLIAVFSIIVNALASFFLLRLLSNFMVSEAAPSGLAHVGVSLATSSVALVNFGALLFFMKRKIKRLNGRAILKSLTRISIASAIMSLSAYSAYFFLEKLFSRKTFPIRLIEVLLPVSAAIAVFIISARLLKIEELNKLLAAFKRRRTSSSQG